MLLCLAGAGVICLFAYFILPFNVFKVHDLQRAIISNIIKLTSFNLRPG